MFWCVVDSSARICEKTFTLTLYFGWYWHWLWSFVIYIRFFLLTISNPNILCLNRKHHNSSLHHHPPHPAVDANFEYKNNMEKKGRKMTCDRSSWVWKCISWWGAVLLLSLVMLLLLLFYMLFFVSHLYAHKHSINICILPTVGKYIHLYYSARRETFSNF